MPWTTPAYPRKHVNAAGRCLVNPSATRTEYETALLIVNNWRSSHSYPLDTFQMNLRKRATQRELEATIAQRIKRLPSIRHKIERFPGISLASMQDIGGCRAVVSSVELVEDLVNYYENESRIKHELIKKSQYIESPKTSGYRGVHLIYKYYSDKQKAWNGLRIELQIRSRLQHAWATAVETVGLFTQQALKSSHGEKEWLRFFTLMSTVLAIEEGTAIVPGTPETSKALIKELRRHATSLDVVARLSAFNQALNITGSAGPQLGAGKWLYLLELSFDDPDNPQLKVSAFAFKDQYYAMDRYEAVERATADDPARDVVLVQSDDLTSLRRAYPNYYLDTDIFVQSVQAAVA